MLRQNMLFIHSKSNKITISDGSGSLNRKIVSPKIFHRKAIWPKHHMTDHRLTECHLTECHLTESSFDWITEHRLTESLFYRFFFQKICPNLIAHKIVWPKIHLTENFLWKWSFDRKVIWPKVHLTKSFFEKWSFDRMFFTFIINGKYWFHTKNF
jgi:hypothetical protein